MSNHHHHHHHHPLVSKLFLLLISTTYSLSLTGLESTSSVRVVWFRDHALRVRDNDALNAAVTATSSSGVSNSVVPIYLWNSYDDKSDSPVDVATGGTASDVFVANSLNSLNQTLFGRLSLGLVKSENSIRGAYAQSCADEIAKVCRKIGASEVYYMKSCDKELENLLSENLKDQNLIPQTFGGGYTLLDYSNEQDKNLPWKQIIEEHPFRSPLIPFVDYMLERLQKDPPTSPKQEPMGLEESIATDIGPLSSHDNELMTNPLSISGLLDAVGYTKTRIHWGSSIASAWSASEYDAVEALELFLDSLPSDPTDVNNQEEKAQKAIKQTHLASRLSPYLARGLLSPRQVYHSLLPSSSSSADADARIRDRASFVRRICWRDYTYAVVSLFPDVTQGRPIREGYYSREASKTAERSSSLSPSEEDRCFRLWKKGATGFPLVDAGMRQLALEGWMPQKVRLAVSTCLVEGLGVSWELGMKHFADYLVDYDASINSNMWMNAGCVGFDPYYVGTDYKRRPYWDKRGEYVRKWCPELSELPDACEIPEVQRGIGTYKVDCLYEPWSAPKGVLHSAGVTLGRTYPHRCCDDRRERKRFFESLRSIRSGWPSSGMDERGRDMVRLGRDEDCESIGMFTPKALLVGKPKS